MNGTEEMILLTLILYKRRKKREIIAQHVQNLDFECEIFFSRRERHAEFHRLVQELTRDDCGFFTK